MLNLQLSGQKINGQLSALNVLNKAKCVWCRDNFHVFFLGTGQI